MAVNLERLAHRLRCPRCRACTWHVVDDRLASTLACVTCGARYPCENGVIVLAGTAEDREVAREREAVRATERNPVLGGINASFDDLSRAEGALRNAILALPYGDGSPYYEEPGYFRNVRSSAGAFNFLLRNAGIEAGEQALDLGADLTWATSQLARRGLACTALDVNHHLPVAHLFERAYGVSYDLVQADMTAAPFCDAAFDIVIGIDALHHSNRLDALAANIARILKPGGRLGFVEPYCTTEDDRNAFGRAQIDAGINEHVYPIERWHEAFARAGLVVRTHRLADSFAAIYEKPRETVSPPPQARLSRDDLLAGFYEGRLDVLLDPPSRVRPGEALNVLLRVENRGRHTWCTDTYFGVRASYHLSRVKAAALSGGAPGETVELVAWDNERTALPGDVAPGDAVTMAMKVVAPKVAGDYVADIDLVQEYISWFAGKGVESRRVRFRVVD